MLKIESYKKGIIISTVLNILTKGISFLITLSIAYYFGITIETDLYFYIFSTVTLVASFINGMDLTVIIPEGMHLEQNEGRSAAMLFYNFFAIIYFFLGIIIFIVLFFFAIPFYKTISSFNVNVLTYHHYLLIISSALPLFLILSNYLTSVLTTLKYFTMPLIANGIAYSSALLAAIMFHKSAGISAVITGLVGGYILNVILLLLFMYFKLNWKFTFSLKGLSGKLKKNLLSVQLGNFATFAFNYGIIILLSGIGNGVYSAYTYSMQIVNIPLIFIVAQTSAVAGIKFNELAAKHLNIELNRIFQESIGVLLFLIVPFCLITFLYTHEIVNFLFLRGDFTLQSAEKVTLFLKYLIFLVPFLTINTFISRIMTAEKKVSQAFYFQLGFNVVLLLLLIVATRYYVEYGFIFTMLSVYFIYISVICTFLFKWLLPFIDYYNVLKSFTVIILFNIVFIFIYYKIWGTHQPIINVILIACSYYLILIAANFFLKINNSTQFYISNILKKITLKIK